jgi:hypothetical protein
MLNGLSRRPGREVASEHKCALESNNVVPTMKRSLLRLAEPAKRAFEKVSQSENTAPAEADV